MDFFNLEVFLLKLIVLKSESCAGGKKAKDRLAVLICGNMFGEIMKPLVICKSQKPQCFKNIDIFLLPAMWKFNFKKKPG